MIQFHVSIQSLLGLDPSNYKYLRIGSSLRVGLTRYKSIFTLKFSINNIEQFFWLTLKSNKVNIQSVSYVTANIYCKSRNLSNTDVRNWFAEASSIYKKKNSMTGCWSMARIDLYNIHCFSHAKLHSFLSLLSSGWSPVPRISLHATSSSKYL